MDFVKLKIDASIGFRFYPLIEGGYWAKVSPGTSIEDYLIKDLMLDADYVERHIQTIFLNHKPVDAISSMVLSENDKLAFSAAMPGLLGATLRKSGTYSAMRKNISYHGPNGDRKEASSMTGEKIWIFVKFFNLIVREIGGKLLKKGIWVGGKHFRDFLNLHTDVIKPAICEIVIDDHIFSFEKLFEKIDPDKKIQLKVENI